MRSHAKAASAPSTHRENATFSLGVLAAMLLCAAAFLGIGAPAASAATAENSYAVSPIPPFGPGSGNAFGYSGTTVDPSSGNIFFGKPLQGSVSIYAPDPLSGGSFLTEFETYGPSNPNITPQNLALDPTDGTVYVDQDPTIAATIGVAKFTSDGQPIPTYAYDSNFTADFVRAEGMAVDPASHDLLVADSGAGVVFRFSSSGTLLDEFDGGGTLQSPVAVAVGPTGAFYVVDSATATVQRYSAPGASLGALPIWAGSQPSAITTNPATGEVAVFTSQNGQGQLEVFDAAGTRLDVVSLPSIAEAHGLGWDDARERIYLDVGNATAYVLVPAIQPGVDAPDVESSGRNTAHVSAKVAPGGEPTTAWIEYCLAASNCAAFSSSNPFDPKNPWKRGPEHEVLSGSGEETIEDDLPLSSNTEWKLRTFAKNAATTNISAETTFFSPLLPPVVETRPAESVTESTAVLTGTIDTVGDQTTYHFEYGTTAAYGSRAPAAIEAPAGNGRAVRSFSLEIEGLAPGTTYHYRLVAENSLGVAEGMDVTFTTDSAGSAVNRVFEQVTPVDKHGVPVDPSFGFIAKEDGSQIAYQTRNGSVSSPQYPFWLSRRGAEDWEGPTFLDAPTNAFKKQFFRTVLAVSPDFTRTLVATNRKLTPEATENAANLYIKVNSSGTYEFVGSSDEMPLALEAFVGLGAGEFYLDGASDFSWVYFYSQPPLLPGAPSFALYRWSVEDGLEIVSVLPDGSPVSSPQRPNPLLPTRSVSQDGTRAYFTSGLYTDQGEVFLREGKTTKAISVSHLSGELGVPQKAALLGVSKDGRYAFLSSDGAQLTADAPGLEGDLYRYDASSDELEYLGDQIAHSNYTRVAHESFVFANEAGDTVYYAATDDDGLRVIRVWRDGQIHEVSDGSVSPSYFFASPNGRYLAFETGSIGSGPEFLGPGYLYDADTDRLECVSCQSDGTPKNAFMGWTSERTTSNRLPQAVSDTGEVFFSTTASLTPADVNGYRDVYMYRGGKQKLISPGTGPYPAFFADMSRDGSDVFFTTAQRLVARDIDEAVDIYDARIGGGLPNQNEVERPRCTAAGCAPVPDGSPAPSFGGSEAVSGPGSAKASKAKKCRHGSHRRKVKGKVRCVKKKGHTNRRTGKTVKGGQR